MSPQEIQLNDVRIHEKNNKIVINTFKTQLGTSVGFINRQQQIFTFPQLVHTSSYFWALFLVFFIYAIFFYQQFRSPSAPGSGGHRKLSGIGLLNMVDHS